MWRAAARSVKNAPSRLTLSTRRHSAVVMSTKPCPALRPPTPALAKQASTRPSVETVSSNARSTAASSATSQACTSTRPPCLVSARSAARFLSAFVPQIATAAPACARASAMPSPMPLLPPVTSATLPVRSNAG